MSYHSQTYGKQKLRSLAPHQQEQQQQQTNYWDRAIFVPAVKNKSNESACKNGDFGLPDNSQFYLKSGARLSY